TASRLEQESQHIAKFEGKVEFENLRVVEYDDGEETHNIVLSRAGELKIVDDSGKVLISYNVPYGSVMLVSEGDSVIKGIPMCKWDPFNALLISELNGTVQYKDIIDSATYTEETDSQTGHREKVIIEAKDKSMVPTVVVKGSDDRIKETTLPVMAHLIVDDGELVQAGQTLAKIPRSAGKSKDITAGLPR